MIPHADTIYTINSLEYPLRLRYAASQRLAASADTGGRSRVGVAWPGGMFSRLRGASQRWMAHPLTPGAAEFAQRVN